MELFRNSDMKQSAIFFLIFSILVSLGGFRLEPAFGGYIAVVCLGFSILYFYLMKQRAKKIQEIVLLIDRTLHGEEQFDFAEFKEGELAILRDEIYKMTLRLKGQARQLTLDKQFLADSLADISHQLKTPLTALNLLTERMRGCIAQEGTGRRFLKEMQEQLKRIEWLITVLLKLSRLDAETISFRKEYFFVESLIDTALEPLLIPIELKAQTVQVHSEGERFLGDRAWMAEALGNILKNCMEHTPYGGKIEIFSQETSLYLELRIEDTGEGVPEEELSHLFERFYRGKNAAIGSAGIGLALAKAIILSQNGSIIAKNKTGGGMSFILRFYKSIV